MAIKSRRMRWSGNTARMEEMRNIYTILAETKPKAKKLLGSLKTCSPMGVKYYNAP
jgi:hypothetical protein